MENKAVGRTKGDTKIHAIVDGPGNPVAFLLSPGNDNDSIHAIELMDMTDIAGSSLFGDKVYGTEEISAYIRERGAGIFVSAVNPKLIKDDGNNSLCKFKTDKADSKKTA